MVAKLCRQPADAFRNERRFLAVDQIEVLPQWQGRGIGRLLPLEANTIARTQDIHELETTIWSFNEASQVFFRAQGFVTMQGRWWKALPR